MQNGNTYAFHLPIHCNNSLRHLFFDGFSRSASATLNA